MHLNCFIRKTFFFLLLLFFFFFFFFFQFSVFNHVSEINILRIRKSVKLLFLCNRIEKFYFLRIKKKIFLFIRTLLSAMATFRCAFLFSIHLTVKHASTYNNACFILCVKMHGKAHFILNVISLLIGSSSKLRIYFPTVFYADDKFLKLRRN